MGIKMRPNYEAISELDIRDICSAYDVNIVRGSILCPVHNDRHYGSCRLYHNRFYCFACHATGGAVELVAALYSETKNDAAIRISEDFGIPMVGEKDTDWKERMPFTNEQLDILGFRTGADKVLDLLSYAPFKMEELGIFYPVQGGRKDKIESGYAGGEMISFSMQSLYKEDKDQFFFLVYTHFCDKWCTYSELYKREEYTKYGKKVAPILQQSLEYVISELLKVYRYFLQHKDIATKAWQDSKAFYSEECEYLSYLDPAFLQDDSEYGFVQFAIDMRNGITPDINIKKKAQERKYRLVDL